MYIGKIEQVILLGGGALLTSLGWQLKKMAVPIKVVSSPRQAMELVDKDKTLSDILERCDIPLLVKSKLYSDEICEFCGELSNSFVLSLGAAWIFDQQIINDVFGGRIFNAHGTRLPQNRGGGGFSWQILTGNRLGFCNLHLVDEGVDTGPLVATREFLYDSTCRVPLDYQRLYQEKNLEFLLDFIKPLLRRSKHIVPKAQQNYLSTYWPRLNTPIHGWIDWNYGVVELERFILAFDSPYEGAKTVLNGQTVFIKDVLVDHSDPQFHAFQSGLIYRKGVSWLCVCAIGGSLLIGNIRDENGKNIFDSVKLGDRFWTPSEYLDNRNVRVNVTPDH